MTAPPKIPEGDDFNIDVDLESVVGAASLEVAILQAEIRRLQRRVAGFEAANAELSAAPDAASLLQIWRRVSTWGFEDAGPRDGVSGILAEAAENAKGRAQAEAALEELAERLAHLRRIPCRDCMIIPCPACTEQAGGKEEAVLRRAELPEENEAPSSDEGDES